MTQKRSSLHPFIVLDTLADRFNSGQKVIPVISNHDDDLSLIFAIDEGQFDVLSVAG